MHETLQHKTQKANTTLNTEKYVYLQNSSFIAGKKAKHTAKEQNYRDETSLRKTSNESLTFEGD